MRKIISYPDSERTDFALKNNEPLLVLISFDGSKVIMGHIDDSMEHHILLMNVGEDSRDIDRYFRIVLDNEGADWTFVCPPDYKGIADKTRRVAAFYKDGFAEISDFLTELGLLVGISIPRRYRRHLDYLSEK